MNVRHGKDGWVVYEQREDETFIISPAFDIPEKAGVERDRMSALPQYQGKELEIKYSQTARNKKRRPTGSRHTPRR
jgi:hypothetical protein